jgi:hypothetical protein
MGELQARSWIVAGTSSLQQASKPGPIVDGSPQSTPASMQAHWVQRQLGLSSRRA